MANRYDTLKLEKGMYQEAGSTFTQVLERLDPSEQYKAPAWRLGRLSAPAQAL